VYIPRPEYGTRLDFWHEWLIPHSSILNHDVHYSLLAKLSDGWTGGMIKATVSAIVKRHKKMLQEEQIERELRETDPMYKIESGGKAVSHVGKKLIKMDHIMDEMSNFDPVFIEQDKAWNAWFNKTPLQKARLQEQGGGGKGKDKKGKKGAKGGKGGKGKSKGKGRR